MNHKGASYDCIPGYTESILVSDSGNACVHFKSKENAAIGLLYSRYLGRTRLFSKSFLCILFAERNTRHDLIANMAPENSDMRRNAQIIRST